MGTFLRHSVESVYRSNWHSLYATDQQSRRVCRNADSPSISIRMATVSTAQMDHAQNMSTQRTWSVPLPCTDIGVCMKKCHSTADSSVTHTHTHTECRHFLTTTTCHRWRSLFCCCWPTTLDSTMIQQWTALD